MGKPFSDTKSDKTLDEYEPTIRKDSLSAKPASLNLQKLIEFEFTRCVKSMTENFPLPCSLVGSFSQVHYDAVERKRGTKICNATNVSLEVFLLS